MRFLIRQCTAILAFLCFFSNAQISEREAEALGIPSCSLDCLVTIVPEYGCSLTNTTCICGNAPLAKEVDVCVSAACNITETLRLASYQGTICGVKNNKKRQTLQKVNVYVVYPLVVIVVALRFYSRRVSKVSLRADDWTMLAALLVSTAGTAIVLSISFHGFGQHIWWLTTRQIEQSLMYFYISEPLYILTLTLTKISLLLFFLRIFPNRKLTKVIYGIMGFIVLTNVILTALLVFQCMPIYGFWTNWEYKVAPVKCLHEYALSVTAAGMSMFHDLIIIITPLPVLWKLNLPWRKKINVLAMFSMGTFVLLCALIRLPYLFKVKNSFDQSWEGIYVTVWSELEVSVGIICGCLPAIRSLVSHLFPSKPPLHKDANSLSDSSSMKFDSAVKVEDVEKRRMDSQVSFFELGNQECGACDGTSGWSKDNINDINGMGHGKHTLPCAPGADYMRTDIGRCEEIAQGDGIVITKCIEQTRSS